MSFATCEHYSNPNLVYHYSKTNGIRLNSMPPKSTRVILGSFGKKESKTSSCVRSVSSGTSVSSAMYQTRQNVIEKLLQNEAGSSEGNRLYSDPLSGSVMRNRHWSDPQTFIQDNLKEIYEKLPNLEKQIWGKLTVMEGSRRTAKAYLRHPVITIDGSDVEFDGLRIGLSRFENPDRTGIVSEIFHEILDGVKVKIDPDGNVWAKRMCLSPVFLKPLYRDRSNDLFVIDQRPVKVFDIRRFKEILVQELRQPQPDKRRLEKCCLICLKFSIDHFELLKTPCWVIVVHLVAIELLNLVLPKDDFLSPNSGYLTSMPPRSLDPSVTHDELNYQLDSNLYGAAAMPPARPQGRANRGGVFKRIVRKEEQPYITTLGDIQHPRQAYNQNAPIRYQPEPDTQLRTAYARGIPMRGGVATSLVDLRQLNQHYAPVYFSRPTHSRYRRFPAPVNMGKRNYSAGALNSQYMDPIYAGRGLSNVESKIVAAQLERQYRLRKWKSQDSGIVLGSGTDSFGSK